eukprot:scaffold51456_cov63-Phaeocystis_antarctica.AAC.5
MASLYILSRRVRQPISTADLTACTAPAPRPPSPTHPHPTHTLPCPDIYMLLPSAPKTTFFMLVLGAAPVERV